MIPTIVVIPTRYEPDRLRRLLRSMRGEADLLVFDNGHEPPLAVRHVTVIDARGDGLYHIWNRGWQMARERHPIVNVAVLNDDITILPGTHTMLAEALRSDPRIGVTHPDISARGRLPRRMRLTTRWDTGRKRGMTGFCFMFKGELDLPPFDESMEWWYGDTLFDEAVRRAGYGVARVDGVPIIHSSDSEANGWARRPELRAAVARDRQRWMARA